MSQHSFDWIEWYANYTTDCGYSPIPYNSKNPKGARPFLFGEGQSYPLAANEDKWHCSHTNNDWLFGIRLDDCILVDYDGNKAAEKGLPIISLNDLAHAFGLTLEQLNAAQIQTNVEGDSLHFLFRIDDVAIVDAIKAEDGYKQANNGRWTKFIDIKTANQLVYIRSDKKLTLPPKQSLLVAPQSLLDVLKINEPTVDTSPVVETSVTTAHGFNEVNRLIKQACDVEEGERNDWLGGRALRIFEYVNGGEVSNSDAIQVITKLATILDQKDNLNHTLKNTKAKAVKSGVKRTEKGDREYNKQSPADMFKGLQGGIPDNVASVDGITPRYQWSDTIQPNHFCAPLNLNHKLTEGKPCIENIEAMVNVFGAVIRYNEVSQEIELVLPPSANVTCNHVLGYDAALAQLTSLAVRSNIGTKNIDAAVRFIASKNSYNPLIDWIESKPWDGIDRRTDFINIFNTDVELVSHRDAVMRRWLFACIHMWYNTEELGRNQRNVLVFQGAQSAGKTKRLQYIMGDMAKYLEEAVSLHDCGSKDFKIKMSSNAMVEFGEIDAMSKKEVSAMKATVTMHTDNYRPPYGRSQVNMTRKAVFYGTVNDEEFLTDTTGNTRFQVVKINSIGHLTNDFDAQQLWAQMKVEYEAEVASGWSIPCELTSDESATSERINNSHRVKDDCESYLEEWKALPNGQAVNMDLTANKLVEMLPTRVQNKTDSRVASAALRSAGYSKTSKNQPFKGVRVPNLFALKS